MKHKSTKQLLDMYPFLDSVKGRDIKNDILANDKAQREEIKRLNELVEYWKKAATGGG